MPAVAVRTTTRTGQRTPPVARWSALWTVRLWQSRPELVLLRSVDGVAVVRVSGDRSGGPAEGPPQQRPRDGYCEVHLLPNGRVTVACDCAPPAVRLPSARGGQPKTLPMMGTGRCTAAIGFEETLLLMSSTVAENGPAVVRHLLDDYLTTSRHAPDAPDSPGAPPLDDLFRQLTEDHPEGDFAVVVLRRTRPSAGDVERPLDAASSPRRGNPWPTGW